MISELKLTSDGTHTLFVPELNEHYHSINGAMQESIHVFIESGLKQCKKNEVKILEVGFGTGLNALLSLHFSINNSKTVIYHGIERFPLSLDKIKQLNYTEYFPEEYRDYFVTMHMCRWNTKFDIHPQFHFKKIEQDFRDYITDETYDIVYFDAFGPDKQPELWKKDHFLTLYNLLNTGGILTTYSAKGEIKRILKTLGLEVESIPGPPGKREMIRATKI